MKLNLSKLSLQTFLSGRFIASAYIIMLCTGISSKAFYLNIEEKPILAIALMAMSPFLFIFKAPIVSKAVWWGMFYWGICYFSALFNGDMRFSTLGYMGMFVITFVVFYNLIHQNVFTPNYLMKLLRGLIIAYGVVLILQQIAVLIGIRSLSLINLHEFQWLSITKLPSLSYEPSHSARILTVAMLGYLRCIEIENHGNRPSIIQLFSKDHRTTMFFFLWSMLTMGSGTAFIGLGLLGLYFIRWNTTAIYVLPLLVTVFYIGQQMELKNLERAKKISIAMIEGGEVKSIQKADGNASTRILPMVNTITKTDLTSMKDWFGKGTMSKEEAQSWWQRDNEKIALVEQYGLIGLLANLIFVFMCVIHRVNSLETLMFIILFSFALVNIYYTWGCMLIFASIKYFKECHYE